ncbi:MAG: YdeI/OmpD-associated family protein [Chloroflexota bacterium]
MKPIYFKDQDEFRKWLEINHDKESEVIVGYHKVKTNKSSMTWSQSVDQALCFGWIDGIRRSVDQDKYCIRFTPRRPDSNWSNINIRKVEELNKKGLMTKEGMEIFRKRKKPATGTYSFEKDSSMLSENLELMLRSNNKAWEFFTMQAPSYKRTIIHWIMDAKQENTKISRLNKLIMASENHKKIF